MYRGFVNLNPGFRNLVVAPELEKILEDQESVILFE